MRGRRFGHPSFFAVAVALVLAAASCSNDDDPCGQPIYGGDATDEAWRTMVDGEDRAQVGDPNAPAFTLPTEGQVFASSAAAPRFTWTSPIALGPKPPSSTRFASVHRSRRSWLDAISDLLIPKAYAHLPPVTGDIYYLQIDVPGRECPYRVLTTNLDWQIDDQAWSLFRGAAGQTITVRMLSAYLTENRITEGPYAPAAPRTFSVSP
jgi:hypothetical protein